MKVAIIGSGKMGRWFAHFFIKEGVQVWISDKNRKALRRIGEEIPVQLADTITAVSNADVILICVPMQNFEDVIKEIRPYVRPHHVIFDICTFKELPVKIMHKHIKTGIALGTHPLFAEYAKTIKMQNWILTPTNSQEEAIALSFKRWLESRQASVYIMSPKRHDQFMQFIMRLPRVASFLLYHTNKRMPSLLSIMYRILSQKTNRQTRFHKGRTADDFSMKRHYKRWWSKAGFAEPSGSRLRTFQNWARLISSLSKPSSVILDVGCGSGTLLRMLKSKGSNHLIGTDLENVFQQEEGISFIVAEATHLPLRRESVDIILAKRFVSVSDLRESLKELSQTIKKDGKILADVPNMERLKGRIYRLLGLELKFPGTKYYPRVHLKSFLRIIHENGLQVLQVGGDYVRIPFLGFVTSKLNNGLIEDIIGRAKPDLCSHILAICSKTNAHDHYVRAS